MYQTAPRRNKIIFQIPNFTHCTVPQQKEEIITYLTSMVHGIIFLLIIILLIFHDPCILGTHKLKEILSLIDPRLACEFCVAYVCLSGKYASLSHQPLVLLLILAQKKPSFTGFLILIM